MIVEEFSHPIPHMIFSDFFPEETIEKFLDEAVGLDSFFELGLIGRKIKSANIKRKRAKELWLEEITPSPADSTILQKFKEKLWESDFISICEKARGQIYKTLKFTKIHYTHLIRYGDEDFYNWHEDNFEPPYGFLTISYTFCSKEKKFEGGDFELVWNGERKIIPFKNNSVIIFPKEVHHRVTPIKLESDNIRDMRYSVQVWPE